MSRPNQPSEPDAERMQDEIAASLAQLLGSDAVRALVDEEFKRSPLRKR
jgi:hypothetical protein